MPQAKFVQDGDSIDYTPTTAKTAGDVIVIGSIVGVVGSDLAANQLGALAINGVFDVAQAAVIITAGQDVYWDADGDPVGGTAGSGAATNIPTGNTCMGKALATTAATDATVRVRKAAGAEPTVPMATVAAAGTTQADATPITAQGFVLVTAADGNKGVKLPVAVGRQHITIKNADAANAILKVYPNTDDAVNALAANAAFSMPAKTSAEFYSYDGTTWYTVPLLPS